MFVPCMGWRPSKLTFNDDEGSLILVRAGVRHHGTKNYHWFEIPRCESFENTIDTIS